MVPLDALPPALILLGGFPDRTANTQVAALLSTYFTVYNYDRRGHGDTPDSAPYSVDREYEDFDALIGAAGGSAFIYGTSGGGIMALEAAARGLAVTKIAIWEAPYFIEGSRPPLRTDYRELLTQMISENRRGDAVELFFTEAVGIPAPFVAPMRSTPFWPSMEKVAHTLIYDSMVVGDYSLPVERLASVTVPTLVLDGGTSNWLTDAANAVADALPNAQRRTLEGQPHNVAPEAVAPALVAFFAS